MKDALSASWQVWLAESLIAGRPVDELVAAMVERGVGDEEARHEIRLLECSAGVIAGRRVYARDRPARLLRDLLAVVSRIPGDGVERRAGVSAEAVFGTYLATSTPVILTDVCDRWPALSAWTDEGLVARVGEAEVEVCVDRAADPHRDRNFKDHTVRMSMAAYVARVAEAGASNDLYMLANHHNIDGPLQPLLADVEPPTFVDMRGAKRGLSFWFGPAGTHTPPHHDTTNILFCQVRGRKRFRLVSPAEAVPAHGFYAAAELDTLPVRVREVVLEPGEALLLPAGWWHDVLALDVSISFSFMCLKGLRNRYDAYTPGRSRVQR